MIQLHDQLGISISLNHPAKRIISLVPSQTELLHYFKLENETIGITKFCIHPEAWFTSKTRIGGTKNVNIDKVRSLKPDLIIANKEENTQEDIQSLREICPVYVSDINTVMDAYDMIKGVGLLTGKEQQAVDLIDAIQEDFSELKKYQGTVLYFIWRDPYMVCGKDNFIDSIISELGFENVISQSRYIEISMDEIQKIDPDYIFLSTEPFPFKTEHVEELVGLTKATIRIVDGEMFSWYGSRMLLMKKYFERFLE